MQHALGTHCHVGVHGLWHTFIFVTDLGFHSQEVKLQYLAEVLPHVRHKSIVVLFTLTQYLHLSVQEAKPKSIGQQQLTES